MKQKLKTHKGTAKRVRVTGSGLKHRATNRRHNFSNKSRKQKRQLGGTLPISTADAKRVARLLLK